MVFFPRKLGGYAGLIVFFGAVFAQGMALSRCLKCLVSCMMLFQPFQVDRNFSRAVCQRCGVSADPRVVVGGCKGNMDLAFDGECPKVDKTSNMKSVRRLGCK